MKGLRVVLGRNVMDKDGFKLFLDGEDITDKVSVKSLRLEVDADRKQETRVHLEVYADNVEILADHTEVTLDEHDIVIVEKQ